MQYTMYIKRGYSAAVGFLRWKYSEKDKEDIENFRSFFNEVSF